MPDRELDSDFPFKPIDQLNLVLEVPLMLPGHTSPETCHHEAKKEQTVFAAVSSTLLTI